MRCPYCKQEINNPDPMRHLIDCHQEDNKLWQVRINEVAARAVVKQQEE